MLAETATKEISESEMPEGFEENRKVAGKGGRIAGNARNTLKMKKVYCIFPRFLA